MGVSNPFYFVEGRHIPHGPWVPKWNGSKITRGPFSHDTRRQTWYKAAIGDSQHFSWIDRRLTLVLHLGLTRSTRPLKSIHVRSAHTHTHYSIYILRVRKCVSVLLGLSCSYQTTSLIFFFFLLMDFSFKIINTYVDMDGREWSATADVVAAGPNATMRQHLVKTKKQIAE